MIKPTMYNSQWKWALIIAGTSSGSRIKKKGRWKKLTAQPTPLHNGDGDGAIHFCDLKIIKLKALFHFLMNFLFWELHHPLSALLATVKVEERKMMCLKSIKVRRNLFSKGSKKFVLILTSEKHEKNLWTSYFRLIMNCGFQKSTWEKPDKPFILID